MAQEDVFKKLVSHCKEYGFVFPSSEIYDGLAAVYDYGQMGVELKNNIKKILVGQYGPTARKHRGYRLRHLYASDYLESIRARRCIQRSVNRQQRF